MNPWIIALLIVIGVAVLILAACFIGTYIIFKQSFGRAKSAPPMSEGVYAMCADEIRQGREHFLSLGPKDVEITSEDGLKLRGLFYENPEAKATIIMVHGFHGNPLTDFGPVFKFFTDRGYSILIPYMRAHGKSEGKYHTFGVKESEDVLLWAKYIAAKHPNKTVILHGVSMGGATVGMASGLELPKEVKGIVNDCGYTSPDQIIAHVREIMHLPAFPFQYFVRFMAKAFAGFSLTQKNAADCYAKCTLPQFFIHGGKDDFVPTRMGVENFNRSASVDKKMVIVEEAGHATSFIVDRKSVCDGIEEFYQKYAS